MKKIINLVVMTFCLLLGMSSYAQMSAPIQTIRSYVIDDQEIEMSNQWITIDTNYVNGDTLSFTTYDSDGDFKYTFPITRIDRDGNKCVYRCNPKGNRESASLTIFTETIHYNVYMPDGEPECYVMTEEYAILRKRTPYGHMKYKFKIN